MRGGGGGGGAGGGDARPATVRGPVRRWRRGRGVRGGCLGVSVRPRAADCPELARRTPGSPCGDPILGFPLGPLGLSPGSSSRREASRSAGHPEAAAGRFDASDLDPTAGLHRELGLDQWRALPCLRVTAPVVLADVGPWFVGAVEAVSATASGDVVVMDNLSRVRGRRDDRGCRRRAALPAALSPDFLSKMLKARGAERTVDAWSDGRDDFQARVLRGLVVFARLTSSETSPGGANTRRLTSV